MHTSLRYALHIDKYLFAHFPFYCDVELARLDGTSFSIKRDKLHNVQIRCSYCLQTIFLTYRRFRFVLCYSSELVQHMMKPFKLMDTILEDKETWDFKDDPDISVYTYLSVLGSGALVPAIVFLLQMIIPILLFLQTLKSERDLEVFGYFGDEKVS
jgi:hypothetical protein